MEVKLNNYVVEEFLEKHNMTYLFLILANLEAERLSNMPYTIKKNFNEKITEMALRHVAENEVPDYIVEDEEGEDNYEVNLDLSE